MPADAKIGVDGVASWMTPADDFYLIDTAFTKPAIAPKNWQLRIHGMVENELVLSYEDLVNRELVEGWVTLNCVSNEVGGGLIGNAWWSGVLLAPILAEAKPLAGADAVLQTSDDGWNCLTPLDAMTDGRQAMLAVAMNGLPLAIEHGFPVRTIVPGLYGYVSATKWVVDMELTTFEDVDAYWTQRGWGELGPVKMSSRDRGAPLRGRGRVRRGRHRRVGVVAAHRHSARSRSLSTAAPGCRPSSPGHRATMRGCSGAPSRRSRRASTPCGCAPPTSSASCRPARSPTCCPTAPPVGTSSSSTPRLRRQPQGRPHADFAATSAGAPASRW